MYKDLLKKGLEYLIISVFFSGFLSLMSFALWDNIEPYVDVPVKLAQLEETVGSLLDPRLIVFDGPGIILNDNDTVEAGEDVEIGYILNRVASCATTIHEIIVDTSTGREIQLRSVPAVKAPVSSEVGFFRIAIPIPDRIQPGEYFYWPRISPIECGVYKDFRADRSEVFKVE